jgi:pimeloyl-ACP methyl ester carboxylesterase
MSKKALLLVAAAGAGVVLTRRRAAARGVDNPVPEDRPAPPPPPVGRARTVTAEDGVALHVVEHGAQDAATATVVLAHGYVQSSALWNGQVRDLVDIRPDLKVVTYDHRGHGRSGRTARERASLEQLARDLATVLDAVAPTGPVLVAGHSMGGMTVMALAEQRPELFGDRIAGAAFVATSAGGLTEVTHGLPKPVARIVKWALPALNEKAVKDELAGKPRKVGRLDALTLFPRSADPALVQEALSHVPSVVVVGDKDLLCPLAHSRAIATALPMSELTVFPGVGHMVHMERREEVSRILVDLVDRALAGQRTLTAV